ncbi:hypothetical protein [Fibrobacter sp. UWH4]|uniref:hypothetical protein n=1 Tax=Fibrobacter sp. UWH4 TaxID=1896210 RepID=UPI00091EE8F1|nr:hypothetical protein [Fibrobacter sp. UWH4]SHK23105.1 hypothetical protein SAMN05720762_101139 [Fibrobacter sp. UWH4]
MDARKSEILKILADRKVDNISIESVMIEVENVSNSFPYNSTNENVLTALENLSRSSKMAEEQRQTIIGDSSCTSL